MVTKQANGQTYAETLAYLELLQPDEVLLNEGRRNSQLAKKILQLYEMDLSLQLPLGGGGFAPISGMQGVAARSSRCGDGFRPRLQDASTVVKLISRSYFDQTKGAELLQRVVREETYDASCSEEYILLSSTYALLHYTQQCLGAAFSKHSVHLTINSGGNNRMTIDRSTVFQLELLANARTGKTRNSLIGTIDRTKTTVGGRLLRANLMSPPTRVDTINSRLDLVDSFLGDEELFYAVLEHLQALPDIDKMLANIALVPWRKVSKKDATGDFETVTDRVANKGISALVCVKSTLAALPLFANALEDRLRKLDEVGLRGDQHDIQDRFVAGGSLDSGRRSLLIGLGGTGPTMMNTQCHHLLRVIISTMRQANLMQVLELVTDIFTDSTSFSRNTNVMRHHACFALKAESNCMMEVCRKAFLANVDDIYKLADEYADTYSMHVTVKHTTARGYFLSIPVEYASDLPQVFIQPAKSGKGISCTTEEVHSLNLRAQENVQDLLLMTHEKIQAVLDVARSHYDAFAALSDAVALLDMCHSFADVVALSRLPWCRPAVCHPEKMSAKECEEMTLTIVNGRYAIETNLASHGSNNPGQFIPNDTFASRSKHFTVITGVNGSGKSTYLKQVAMIVLLAHCGSYVPAERATVPVSIGNFQFDNGSIYLHIDFCLFFADCGEGVHTNRNKR
jgi:DNA mismatch repair protein MSH4